MVYLKAHELFTLEDLDEALQEVNARVTSTSTAMKKAGKVIRTITGIQKRWTPCQTHKAVHDKYLRIGWKARQAVFAETHKDELDSFNKAYRYLKKQGVDLNVGSGSFTEQSMTVCNPPMKNWRNSLFL